MTSETCLPTPCCSQLVSLPVNHPICLCESSVVPSHSVHPSFLFAVFLLPPTGWGKTDGQIQCVPPTLTFFLSFYFISFYSDICYIFTGPSSVPNFSPHSFPARVLLPLLITGRNTYCKAGRCVKTPQAEGGVQDLGVRDTTLYRNWPASSFSSFMVWSNLSLSLFGNPFFSVNWMNIQYFLCCFNLYYQCGTN